MTHPEALARQWAHAVRKLTEVAQRLETECPEVRRLLRKAAYEMAKAAVGIPCDGYLSACADAQDTAKLNGRAVSVVCLTRSVPTANLGRMIQHAIYPANEIPLPLGDITAVKLLKTYD